MLDDRQVDIRKPNVAFASMSMTRHAEDWFRASVIVVIGLIVISALVASYIETNPIFAYALMGGGVLAAIIYGAKKIFYK